MNRYETIAIIDPDLNDEGREPVLSRVNQLVDQQKGFYVKADAWGMKKLAYEIKKRVRGYYVAFDFCGNGAIVDEIERFFRIDDRIIKYMTVVTEKDADVDAIKAAIAAEEEASSVEEEKPQAVPEEKPEEKIAEKDEAESNSEATPNEKAEE